MIGLTEKVDIISMYFNQGMTQEQISEKVGKCIKTVRKYIHIHEKTLENWTSLNKNY